MTNKYTNEGYAHMIFVYGFYNRNAVHVMKEYWSRYPFPTRTQAHLFLNTSETLEVLG